MAILVWSTTIVFRFRPTSLLLLDLICRLTGVCRMRRWEPDQQHSAPRYFGAAFSRPADNMSTPSRKLSAVVDGGIPYTRSPREQHPGSVLRVRKDNYQ